MGDKTGIGWTDATWNPIVGCSRVSEGCTRCYAEREAYRLEHRLGQEKYAGTTRQVGGEPRWTGAVKLWEPVLHQPTRWTRGRRIFVNAMSDLFHEQVRDDWIDQIVSIMAQTGRHTYQILTKRPARMRAYCLALEVLSPKDRSRRLVRSMYGDTHPARAVVGELPDVQVGDLLWPLPNVHWGVSVEDQATADGRIPLLLQTPAAVRWVSYEPALGPVDFSGWLGVLVPNGEGGHVIFADDGSGAFQRSLAWIVVGGESGPAARSFDLAWARATIAQCRDAGISVFCKQLGARPEQRLPSAPLRMMMSLGLRDRKGADMAEWPEDLRVQEFPA